MFVSPSGRPAVNPQAGLLAAFSYGALLSGGMTKGDVAVKEVLTRCRMLNISLPADLSH